MQGLCSRYEAYRCRDAVFYSWLYTSVSWCLWCDLPPNLTQELLCEGPCMQFILCSFSYLYLELSKWIAGNKWRGDCSLCNSRPSPTDCMAPSGANTQFYYLLLFCLSSPFFVCLPCLISPFCLFFYFLFFIMPFFCSLASFHEQLMDCLSQDIAHTSAKDKTCMKSTEREVQWCDPTSVREFILKEKKEKKGTARGKSSQSRWFHTTQDALGEEASPGHLPWGKHSKPTDGHGQSRHNCFWAAASPRLTSQFGSIRPKQQAKSEWNQI